MKRRSFLKSLAATTFAGGLVPEWASGMIEPLHSSLNELQSTISSSDNTTHTRDFFYKPLDGRVGDVIPFFDDGKFRIFHLHKANNVRYDTTWHQVSTDDFVHFTELGEILPRGTPDDQDLSVATGSVIKSAGQYHAFYTGYNSPRKTTKPEQGVMHAVSDDLLKWQKIPADTFYAPESRYERNDWRDPFVFWNEEAHEYWMLVAARLKEGAMRRRGCTALCVSKDLTSWEVQDPFWSPGLYYTHECPDLFRMGEWWYLLFSEFSESNQTRYRMSREITGPWIAPENDTFDCRALYAAKTASNGHSRFLFGWNPLRAGGKDDGKWEWGGSLVIHELFQGSNGELNIKMPRSIDKVFDRGMPLDIQPAAGNCEIAKDRVRINSPHAFGSATLGPLRARCKLVTTVQFAAGCRSCGLMLKLLDDLDTCYYVRFEPARNRMVLDSWPRPGDVPFMTGFERPLKLMPGEPFEVQVILDGTIAEIYVDSRIAMSTRMYSVSLGQLGVFVDEGSASFGQLGIYSMGA